MKFAAVRRFLVAGSLLATELSCTCAPGSNGFLPNASAVMARVVQRASDSSRTLEADEYAFEKCSINEDLDNSGKPTKTEEKTYEIIPIKGVPFSRLVKIQNRNLTEKETEVQNRKEMEFRQRLAGKEGGSEGKKNKNWLDARVVDRFDFKVERRDTFGGRPVLILSFRPKAIHGPARTVEDKVLNRLTGTLWVDEQEAEISQLKVGLTEDLSLGLWGTIGSLKQFDLTLERERLADGVWVTQKQAVVMCGRKLFTSIAHRVLEESTHFRKP
jgi:hypothetical protein